jgi:hypothetical protein
MFDRETFNRLEDEVEASVKALSDHVRTAVVVWYGTSPPKGPERAIDQPWLDEYHALHDRRDRAEAHLIAFLTEGTLSAPIVPGGEGPIPIPPGSPLSPNRKA